MLFLRTTVYLFLLLMCISLVSASTPDYSVVQDFEENVYHGDGNAGSLIFNKENYISETHEVSDFTNYTFQRFDKMKWNGNSTIEITDIDDNTEVVTKGSEYYFAQEGQYDYKKLSSPNITQTIIITQEDQLQLKISDNSNIMILDYDKQFTLGNDERVVDIDYNLPIQSIGSYDIDFFIEGNSKNQTISKTFKSIKVVNWTMKNDTVNNSIRVETDSFKNIGRLIFENKGNTFLTLTAQITGEGANFISIPTSQDLNINSFAYFDVFIQIPNKQPNGNYPTQITFNGDGQQVIKKINITIDDVNDPEIRNLTIESDVVWVKNKVTLIGFDNIELDYAEISYNNKTYGMEKDQQVFTYEKRFDELTPYEFEICLYDMSENFACQSINKTFEKLDAIDSIDRVVSKGKKIGKFSKLKFGTLNLSLDDPINITLDSFYSDIANATDYYTLRVVDGNGEIHDISKIGDSVQVSKGGDIYLEALSNRVSEFTAILKIDTVDYMLDEQQITLEGKFLEYDVIDSVNVETSGIQYNCTSVDTGNVEDSYINCVSQYPITTDVNSLIIPITVEQKKLIDDQIEQYEADKDKMNFILTMSIIILLGIIVAIFCVAYFSAVIYPNLRFRIEGRD